MNLLGLAHVHQLIERCIVSGDPVKRDREDEGVGHVLEPLKDGSDVSTDRFVIEGDDLDRREFMAGHTREESLLAIE
jgi:hypothetical protein